jgi:hypothetical protein
LLGNNHETNETIAIVRKWPARQWTGWIAVFSALSTLMTVHTIRSSVFYAVCAEGL